MKTSPKLLALALGLALVVAAIGATPAHARLDVEVWTDRGDDAVYQAGEAMRVKVRTSENAFLLVYELDTEGRVNLLYPWKRGIGRIDGQHTLRLPPDDSDYQLVVEKETGQGFLVAIASDRPFRDLPWFLRPFDPQAASVGYEGAPDDEEEGFDNEGRVVGDPYVAMERIRRRVVEDPADTEGFASAYSTYYVHEQVRYPRYLCNDCHRPRYWAWWDGFDPYYANCSVFDFRVNWSWYWGPHIWTSYTPYYYYVVRTDCPPRYSQWAGNRNRFSAWDGWNRWTNLWGGQLRRYKPDPAPVSYVPPPPRGMIWKKGETPPGIVPPDVRRETKSPGTRTQDWLTRKAPNGRPVWKESARKDGGQGREGTVGRGDAPTRERSDEPIWRKGERSRPDGTRDEWQTRRGRGDGSQPPPPSTEPEKRRERAPIWKPSYEPRRDSPRREEPQRFAPPRRERQEPQRQEPQRQEPQRQEPSRQEPQKQDPGYQQAPPRNDPPRVAPPKGDRAPDFRGGGKGRGKG